MVVSCVPPTAVAWSDMRMNKSGSFATTPNNVQAKIAGWTVDGSYPGTAIASDYLIPNGTKAAAIVANVSLTLNAFSNGQIYIRVNGVQVATSGPIAFAYNTITLSCAAFRTLNAGDTVELWVSSSDMFTAGTVNAAGTFLKFDKVDS